MTAALAPPPGLILAGGRSSRMGSDKAFLALGGDTLIGHVTRRLSSQVSSIWLNAPPGFPDTLPLPVLPDAVPGQVGPLAGVLAGLRHIPTGQAHHILTAPCDSPFFPSDLAARLQNEADDEEAIIVAASADRLHPVFGLWPFAIAEDLAHWLDDPDNRRIHAFLRRHLLVTVDFPLMEMPLGSLDPFFNINTPEDLEQARRFADVLS